MKHLKTYKIFESVDSDFEDIKDIMNDISDLEDNIGVYIELVRDATLTGLGNPKIKINIYPNRGDRSYFRVNQNIKSVIQRLNHLYKDDYIILYYSLSDLSNLKWIKFYVYDDERGLRDYDSVRMDGSGKFPAPKIYRMEITMIEK